MLKHYYYEILLNSMLKRPPSPVWYTERYWKLAIESICAKM